jgi:Uma2 family endonuclease
MATQPRPRLTPEQYLELERRAEYKSEYFDGEMFAMSGGTAPHSLIANNVIAALHVQLRDRPCRIFNSDLRVLVSPSGLYTYPDISIVCGEPRFRDEVPDTLLNPVLIVEVLSKSTEAYDRGTKFKRYREIESLRGYLLVASESIGLDYFTPGPDGRWTLTSVDQPDASLTLEAVGCSLRIADVYHKVDFAAA